MVKIIPELEIPNDDINRIKYIEHGWPSELCRWHFHNSYELHLLVHSKGSAFVGDYIGNFSENSLFFIGPYVPHNWICYDVNKIAMRDILIQFNDNYFNTDSHKELKELKELFELSQYGIEFKNCNIDYCRDQFVKIKNSSGVRRMNLTLEFLYELNQVKEKKKLSLTSFNNQVNSNDYSNISNAISYINENYNKSINLDSIGTKFGFSPSSFSRYFHQSTGNCFSSFINRVRISRACLLLQQTDYLISTISYKVGYNNLSNFNRQFISFKCMTPTKYRQTIKKQLKIRTI